MYKIEIIEKNFEKEIIILDNDLDEIIIFKTLPHYHCILNKNNLYGKFKEKKEGEGFFYNE